MPSSAASSVKRALAAPRSYSAYALAAPLALTASAVPKIRAGALGAHALFAPPSVAAIFSWVWEPFNPTTNRHGCAFPLDAAHRAASNTFLSVSGLTSRSENERALQRSWITGNTPSTGGAFFSLCTSLAVRLMDLLLLGNSTGIRLLLSFLIHRCVAKIRPPVK